jgi:tetratricopeptide (TPR) repeat protein
MTNQGRIVIGAVLAAAWLVVGIPAPTLADGGGGTTSPQQPLVTEDPDLTAAVKAIKAEKFAAAIPLLENVIKRQDKNADAYNWLAYAVRRNGDPARSIPIYEKALALDPKHRGAHEYIGEAYLALDNLAKAKEHLATLNRLCLLPCGEYSDLKKAVESYEKSKGQGKPRAGR